MPKKSEKSAQKKGYVKKGGNGGARKGAGRKPFVPTDEERKYVKTLAGYGVPHEQIAALIRDGIHVDTLRFHFAHELVAGKAMASGKIGETLYKKAVGGDVAALIWWSKAQLRWKGDEPPAPVQKVVVNNQAPASKDEILAELKARGLPTSIFDK